MSDKSTFDRVYDVAKAMEEKGIVASNTVVGAVIQTRDVLNNEFRELTGKGVTDVLKDTIGQDRSNHRLLELVVRKLEENPKLEQSINNGYGRAPEGLPTAMAAVIKKTGAVLESDPVYKSLHEQASKLHEAKTKNAMAQVSGLSNLIGGASDVKTHSGPSTAVASVGSDTPVRKA